MSIHHSLQSLSPLLPPSLRARLLARIALLAPLSVAVFAALIGSGCKAPVTHDAAAQASARPRAQTAMGGVRTGAAYQQAVKAYRAHRYADALHLLNTLSATPDLTEQDKAFLLRQRALCQAALSPGKSNAAVVLASPPGSSARETRAVSLSERDCGPRALLLLCQDRRVPATLAGLTKAAHTNADGTSMKGLASAAQTVGLKATGVQVDKDALAQLSKPAIAWVDGNHYVAVLNVHHNAWTGKTSATIADPNHTGKEEMALNDLLRRSGGILLTVTQ